MAGGHPAEQARERVAEDSSQAKLFLLDYYLKAVDGLAGDLEGRVLDQLMELFNVTRTAYHEAVLEKRAGKPRRRLDTSPDPRRLCRDAQRIPGGRS